MLRYVCGEEEGDAVLEAVLGWRGAEWVAGAAHDAEGGDNGEGAVSEGRPAADGSWRGTAVSELQAGDAVSDRAQSPAAKELGAAHPPVKGVGLAGCDWIRGRS